MQQEARALVEKHGGIRAASRAEGIPFATLHRRAYPERVRHADRARQARYRRRHPERVRRADAESKRRVRDEGRCIGCGAPRLSECYCWDCLNGMALRDAQRRAKEAGIATSV